MLKIGVAARAGVNYLGSFNIPASIDSDDDMIDFMAEALYDYLHMIDDSYDSYIGHSLM